MVTSRGYKDSADRDFLWGPWVGGMTCRDYRLKVWIVYGFSCVQSGPARSVGIGDRDCLCISGPFDDLHRPICRYCLWGPLGDSGVVWN